MFSAMLSGWKEGKTKKWPVPAADTFPLLFSTSSALQGADVDVNVFLHKLVNRVSVVVMWVSSYLSLLPLPSSYIITLAAPMM